MKKLTNYMLSMLAIAGMLFLTSCGDDEEDPTPTGGITVVLDPAGDISGDATLNTGSSYSLRVVVNAANGNADLATYKITQDGVALSDFDDVAISSSDNRGFTLETPPIDVPLTAGSYAYEFVVTDEDGGTGSVSWVITAEAASAFSSEVTVSLGAQSASAGSSYDVEGATQFTLADAKSNSADVDFFYYYGATNLATLWAPGDADAVTAGLFGLPGDWATRNETAMDKVSLDFDAATVAEVQAETLSGTKANQLAAGDVVVFETVGGVRGIIEVTAVNGAADGTIDLKMKTIQ